MAWKITRIVLYHRGTEVQIEGARRNRKWNNKTYLKEEKEIFNNTTTKGGVQNFEL
jgi:hypothetical protein